MSHSFPSKRLLPEGANQQEVQRLLDENMQLIQAIVDYQNKGRAHECAQYQQVLHRNLVYLASLADSAGSKPEQGQSAGPGGLVQSPVDGAGVQLGANALAPFGRRMSSERASPSQMSVPGSNQQVSQQPSNTIHGLTPPIPGQPHMNSSTSVALSHPMSHPALAHQDQQSRLQSHMIAAMPNAMVGQHRPAAAAMAGNQFMNFQRHPTQTTFAEHAPRQPIYTSPAQSLYGSQPKATQPSQQGYRSPLQHSGNFQTTQQQLPMQQRYASHYAVSNHLLQQDAGVRAQQQQQQPIDQRFLAPQQGMPAGVPSYGTQSQLLPP